MRRILTRLLSSFGFEEFHYAIDGGEALEQLHIRSVDLSVVNWHMAPMDGIEFTRKIRNRKSSPDPYLPIILLTGFAEPARKRIAWDAGVNEILTKPVSPEQLFDSLTAVVRHPRPYYQTESFFGPDRRMAETTDYDGANRRHDDVQGISA